MDYIDLYQIHRRDQRTPWEETLEALHDLVQAGQGALPGRLLDDGLGVQQGPSPARASRVDALHLHAGQLQPAGPGGRARDASAVRRRRRADNRLQPVGPRAAWPAPSAETTARSQTEAHAVKLDPALAASDQQIIEAVAGVAKERGVSMAQIGLAWLRSKPVVAAPIVGALKAKHIDDAVASLSIALTGEEVGGASKRLTRLGATARESPIRHYSSARPRR